MCSSGEVEDIEHMVMRCEAHARHRNKLLERVVFDPDVSQSDRLDVLLGKSTGATKTDTEIDAAVKRFLKKAWRGRKWFVANKQDPRPQRHVVGGVLTRRWTELFLHQTMRRE